jgi:hypothetical protein
MDATVGQCVRKPTPNSAISLYEHLDRVRELLEYLRLPVSRQAFLVELMPLLKRFRNIEKTSEYGLTIEDARSLVEKTHRVSDVLRFEAPTLQALVLVDKRYSVESLMSGVHKLFGESVFWAMPEIAQFDFTQAGKCIAYEVPTASAFHSLRGTEAVLRSYNSELVTDAIAEHPMWGPMVAQLRKITDDPPPKQLLDNLDNLRISFRNPTQHPESRYDMDDAQDLFNLCVDVVNRMIKDLFGRGKLTESEIPF